MRASIAMMDQSTAKALLVSYIPADLVFCNTLLHPSDMRRVPPLPRRRSSTSLNWEALALPPRLQSSTPVMLAYRSLNVCPALSTPL